MKRFRESYEDMKTRHEVAEWAMKKFIDRCSYEDFWNQPLPFYSIFQEFGGARSIQLGKYMLKRYWKVRRERRQR